MAHHRSAGGIVLGDAGTVAMVRNRLDTKWFFPKGRLDEGEDDETAARREITEEASLTNLELLDDLGEYERPRIGSDNQYHLDQMKTIKMFLFAAEPHTEIRPDNEVVEAKWVPLSQVAESLEDAKDRVWFTTVFDRVRQAIQRD